MLVFKERGKPENLEKNILEQSREPTTNSTHVWRRVRELNPGHINGRRALSPLRHPCSPFLFCEFMFIQKRRFHLTGTIIQLPQRKKICTCLFQSWRGRPNRFLSNLFLILHTSLQSDFGVRQDAVFKCSSSCPQYSFMVWKHQFKDFSRYPALNTGNSKRNWSKLRKISNKQVNNLPLLALWIINEFEKLGQVGKLLGQRGSWIFKYFRALWLIDWLINLLTDWPWLIDWLTG